ncbi:MAG: oligosaccharide flippase family protein, partial [Bacteroidales bacterium]|nr:oligosaccharide flippase family protein [Bacteroidales bacterium]
MYQDAEEMSLKQKTLKGLSWSFIDSFSSQLISFVVMIVLARMLEPEEFGILGYIFIFVSLAGPFIEGGFAQALIKKTNCTTADYSTAFFFNFAMGIVTAGLLYVAAPLISHLLAVPQMTPMLRVMGIFFIICAVGTIQGTIFTKKLDFKTKAFVSIGSSTLAGVIAIIMAYCGLGVWSLIWRIILGAGFGSLVLWMISDWRPSFIFSKKNFKELFGFGYKFFLSDLIRNIYDNL